MEISSLAMTRVHIGFCFSVFSIFVNLGLYYTEFVPLHMRMIRVCDMETDANKWMGTYYSHIYSHICLPIYSHIFRFLRLVRADSLREEVRSLLDPRGLNLVYHKRRNLDHIT